MKTLRSLVVAAGLGIASLVPTVALADLPDMLARGTINIAVPESFPPFGALGMEGEHEGYDVDVATLSAYQSGRVDVLVTGLP